MDYIFVIDLVVLVVIAVCLIKVGDTLLNAIKIDNKIDQQVFEIKHKKKAIIKELSDSEDKLEKMLREHYIKVFDLLDIKLKAFEKRLMEKIKRELNKKNEDK